MKKVLLSLFVAAVGLANAQTISFEQSEGFFPGDINGQSAEWTSTPAGEGQFIGGIVIDDTMASEGTQSLKVPYLDEYGQQDSYIIGAVYTPATPIPWETGFTLSYDFYATALDLSDFTFQLVDFTAGSYITYLDFSYNGNVLFVGDDGMGGGVQHPTTGTWQPNQWYNLRMEFQADGLMHLFLDDVEISTGLPFIASGAGNVEAIRLFTDNWGGDAYYDNIIINGDLATNDFATNRSVSTVYPNPAQDIVKVQLAEGFNTSKTKVSVSNMSGQQVAQFADINQVNVAKLPAGVYVLTITDGVKTESKKLIKK